MHISNFAVQFWLASENFMQNYTIYNPWSRGKIILPPRGINFVKVVRGCQRASFFLAVNDLDDFLSIIQLILETQYYRRGKKNHTKTEEGGVG